ncbi:glycosyltransferase [Rhodospirillaceae bacterium SYSU D60014]|uniref:glycosyltransferase n=1 Tax=Virgifigura deserti TaxID=2268457 RepID=UPI0013C4D9A7
MTRLLNLLGADLPRTLIPPSSNNERGYWESERLREAHDNFLKSVGSRWDDTRSLDEGLYSSAAASRLKGEIREELTENFAESGLFVIKDPRICRFTPLWLSALRDFGAEPRAIMPIRDPREVAASLNERNGFTLTKSLHLWLRHTLDAERGTRNIPRVFLTYDELLSDWRSAVARIGTALSVAWPRSPHEASPDIDGFITSDLRHHESNSANLCTDPEVPDLVKASQSVFLSMTRGEDTPDLRRRLDAVTAALGSSEGAFLRMVAKQEEQESHLKHMVAETRHLMIAELRQTNSQIGKQEEYLKDKIHGLEETVRQLEGTARKLEKTVHSLSESASSLNEQERALRDRIDILSDRMSKQDQKITSQKKQIESILKSPAWTAIKFLGKTKSTIATVSRPSKLARLPSRGNFRLLREFIIIRRSGLFDAEWYLRQYRDVAKAGANPLMHYIRHGWSEGRDPGPNFSTSWYLKKNPDVARAGINPCAHYIRTGREEGRASTPSISGTNLEAVKTKKGRSATQVRVAIPQDVPALQGTRESFERCGRYRSLVFLNALKESLPSLPAAEQEFLTSKINDEIERIRSAAWRDFHEKSSKGGIVVYTCLFGDYDRLKEPAFIDPEVEYICFTDSAELRSDGWRIVRLETDEPNPRRASRSTKILPHKHLPEHGFSVYVDATICITAESIKNLVVEALGEHDIGLYSHPKRNCIYEEGRYCILIGKETTQNVAPQFLRYFEEGFPPNYGLFENAFIVRRNTERIRELNELWWEEYNKGSQRDQLSLMYCLWKLDIQANAIPFGRDFRTNRYAAFEDHEYIPYLAGRAERKIPAAASIHAQNAPSLFSFVAASYDKEDAVGAYLQGIERQDYGGPIEVVLVDDCSSDKTVEIAEQFAERWRRHSQLTLKIIQNGQNVGNCGSRNIGVAAASGEVVCITDADCVPNRMFARNHSLSLRNGANVSIGPMGIEKGTEPLDSLFEALDGDPDLRIARMKLQWPKERTAFINCVTRNFCISRILLDSLDEELFDEDFAYRNSPDTGFGWEDVDMGARLFSRGNRIHFNVNAYTIHMTHSSNISQDVKARGSIRNFCRLLSRNPHIIELFPSWTNTTLGKIEKWLVDCEDRENRDLAAARKLYETNLREFWSRY